MYNNIAYIYQPHFMTNCFRAAVENQQGQNKNFVVVTCSPAYNGVWEYSCDNIDKYTIWSNKGRKCYCIPITECSKIKDLQCIENYDIISCVKKQQENWLNNNVKNQDNKYINKPDWML